jgi:hypothetical protein
MMSSHFVAIRDRALRLLAEKPDGCSRAILLAHGFSLELLDKLIRAGLATATTEREVRGDKTIEVVRIKLTKAGRAAVPRERPRPSAP